MRRLKSMLLAALMAPLAGCAMGELSEDAVVADTAPSFEQFLSTLEREPFEDGVYIADGDIPLESEKRLLDYYYNVYAPSGTALTVDEASGRANIWSNSQAQELTYCVSTRFGGTYDYIVQRMAAAANAWSEVANVRFVHVSSLDESCSASSNVLFDVQPVSGVSYYARAFFPGYSRRYRNVYVNVNMLDSQSEGVLRHELGHVLGFRHEHTRERSNRCYEDSNWIAVTDYDRDSVMHYPQCGGTNFNLELSGRDIAGVQALYGAPQSSGTTSPTGPTTPSTPAPTPGTPRSGSADGSLAAGESARFEPFAVLPGSEFVAQLSGTGDADLYVRFDAQPQRNAFDCRPYLGSANETCTVTVPAGASSVYLMIDGYTASTYELQATWVSP